MHRLLAVPLSILLLALPVCGAQAAPKHRPTAAKKHKAKPKKVAARPKDRPAPTAADAPLAPGRFRFWNGATVASGNVRDESLCDVAGPCFAWPLNVAAGGKRLRVAIDIPMRDDTFALTLIDPAGAVAGSASTDNAFDGEVFADDPAAGLWTVKVVPESASDAAFRMRAKLEKAPADAPSGKTMLLPDLKAVPPLELSFVAPLNPANGLYPPDTVNPPAEAAGYRPFSCTVDEMGPVELQGGAARRCLRFTSGPINAGAGPYEMHWSYTGDLSSGAIDSPIAHGPMTQVIQLADGTSTTRPGGTYSFHVIHGHFHDDGVLDMELFKVGGDATLEKVGVGVKSGFCPANQLLGDWRTFRNSAPDGAIGSGDTGTGNCQNPADGVLGLSPGWGDVYRWQRPGMYVEFGTQPDGIYVVRITIDKGNDVLESDETNNSAYALVKVVGDQAIPLERGQGQSPFDPAKVVFTGSGPASRD
ncbi:MAG: hypothetical protein ACJ762_03515 [Solirubrobacteraceae bacterium]